MSYMSRAQRSRHINKPIALNTWNKRSPKISEARSTLAILGGIQSASAQESTRSFFYARACFPSCLIPLSPFNLYSIPGVQLVSSSPRPGPQRCGAHPSAPYLHPNLAYAEPCAILKSCDKECTSGWRFSRCMFMGLYEIVWRSQKRKNVQTCRISPKQ